MLTVDHLNEITNIVIGSAIEVHRVLGPGLLESTYEECLVWELEQRELSVARQIEVLIRYKILQIERGYRLDMLVEQELIVELKSVDSLQSIH